VFLTDEKGRIRGVNEKGIEVAGQSRIKLIGQDLVELLEAESKEELKKEIKQAWTGLPRLAPLRFSGEGSPETYQATLVPLNMEDIKMLLLLLRKTA
jgi:PAS domain S-box-containing protein